MSSPALDRAVQQVLDRYPTALRQGRLVPLGNAGGFSGASLWRLEQDLGALCLRAWPAGLPSPERLTLIHALMNKARQAGLAFVPVLLETSDGMTFVECAGRRWELTTWMPGKASYHEQPSPARLSAACQCLAQLHRVWGTNQTQGPCSAIERRLARVVEWEKRLANGWAPAFTSTGDSLESCAQQAHVLVRERISSVLPTLKPWRGRPLALQPCLCDVWHDHVLYENKQITGLIDYGAVKIDHVSVDLARLLGSMVGGDRDACEEGLSAYRSVRSLSAEEEDLARALDRTGVIVGAITWLRWLYVDRRVIENRTAAAGRLGDLVKRLEE